MRAAGKSRWHRRTRGDDGDDKAQPQMSDISSNKRLYDGGRGEVVREYAAGSVTVIDTCDCCPWDGASEVVPRFQWLSELNGSLLLPSGGGGA
jgi:hypothetical protein